MSEKEKDASELKEEQLNNHIDSAEEATTNTEESAENVADNKEFGEAEAEDPIEVLQKQVTEEKNKYLRLYAEFENFRKRSAKERIDLIGTASADVLKEMLPILDDFERAIDSNKTASDIESVKEGFELLHNKFGRLMKSKGIESIDPKDEMFDGELHEAIAQMPAQSEDQKGKIFDVVEKGYKLNDKIIRHPKVVVAS
ncbi:MAG: nucleotide exchange factor GrpE [Salibacteraceae bacterium]|nr:nucleotide exchange factor GrpE [Salibacteraceae bacterium]